MRYLSLMFFIALLSACAETAPPILTPTLGPDDEAAPKAALPYRPVMAGTAYHGVGRRP